MTIQDDRLRFQTCLLFFKTGAVRERDASLNVDDSVPGESFFFRRCMQRADHLTRCSWRTGQPGELAVGGHFAFRYLFDQRDYSFVEALVHCNDATFVN